MRIRLGNWVFQPGWLSTAVTLLLLPLLLGLGYWQLDRGRQKAALQAAFAERFQQPAVPLGEIYRPAEPENRYRHVVASGYYEGRQQFLVDNQVQNGQPGYHVLTPLRLKAGTAILVNRGWLPLGVSRQTLPEITVSEKSVTVTGWLAQPTNPGLWWGEARGEDGRWPRVIPYVDYQGLSKLLNYPLQPVVILLDPQVPTGYVRDWQPRFGGIGPERHQGYAVQWFGLAASLIVLFFAVNTSQQSRVEES